MEKNSSSLKAFLSFLILAVAATLFFMFYNNQESIILDNEYQKFFTLAVVGAGLLVGLLYLVSKPHATKKVAKKKSSKKK